MQRSLDLELIKYLREMLSAYSGSILPPASVPNVPACEICRGGVGVEYGFTYTWCAPCYKANGSNLVDAAGFGAYFWKGTQLERHMYSYKNYPNQNELLKSMVATIALERIYSHFNCLEKIIGEIDYWTVLPSTKDPNRSKSLTQPLSESLRILETFLSLPHLPVATSPQALAAPRQRNVSDEKFIIAPQTNIQNKSILIIDDTWVSGSNIYSLSKSLRAENVGKIATFCVAREITPTPGFSSEKLVEYSKQVGYSPEICPWVYDGKCP